EGAGDPDLYVRRGQQPLERQLGREHSEAGFIAPFLPGATESVLVPRVESGEEWFIAVLGMREGSAFQITVEQPLQAYGAPALVPSQPVSGSLDAANPSARFVIDVPPDTSSLTVSMTANADVDLYLRPGLPVAPLDIGRQATGGLLAPFALGGAESVPVVSPTAGPWYVEVVAFDASAEYTLSLAFDSVVVTAGPRPLASLANDSGILARNDTSNFSFDYTGNAALLAFSIGGRGDTDLYVKFAQAIEAAEIGRAWDSASFQAPFLPASNETVYFIDPEAGRYFLTFAGADDFNTYDLVVYEFDRVPETLGLAPLLPGEPQTFDLRVGEAPTREIFVPAGTRRLDITLSGGGDADLVLRYLEPPDPAQYGAVALGPELWLPFAASSDERITITDPLPGVYVLAVVAFAELQTVEVITALE
ncbi:MAG: PPC domain-containing protein, partial [Chloroflexi bacterium]|nr:PPC domain-containing protein [Chloroflexota bacterium]